MGFLDQDCAFVCKEITAEIPAARLSEKRSKKLLVF
jgi:hypothetical protein